MSLAPSNLRAVSGVTDLDDRYRADVWHAADLGVRAARGRGRASFTGIGPLWLQAGVKAWARQRLALDGAFNTVVAATLAFRRFSGFAGSRRPRLEHPGQLDRSLLEAYMAWIATRPVADGTKAMWKGFVRSFLEENRRYRWVPAVPLDAVIYSDEVGSRHRSLPRFISEFVMAQLEAEANLDRLESHYRHLVIVLTETGLRAGDACALGAGAVVTDSAGWPCLRFEAHKMRAEQIVPLSDKAVTAVKEQQCLVTETWSSGSPWLFPCRRDPSLPLDDNTFRLAFNRWQRVIGLRDEAGRRVHVVPHQLRHTLGTRLINQGVPEHVIQRLLGHASPQMTAVYARLHDSTLREQMEHYWKTRVDVEGRVLGFDPGAVTADAEWLKHNLGRAADSLPNGYCGRPPRQECPHPNACLTCPDFQTTVQFLPVHRGQAEATRTLIEVAEAAGHERLAANHRQVLANLERIIPALEALASKEEVADD
ncbi:MAG: tyrosine-type recombinase/integrase [Steroidobacteraceae bacterium]